MKTNADVLNTLKNYPEPAKTVLLNIRNWIDDIAQQDKLSEVEETFKWGEPAYLVKQGSTIRMDYNRKYEGKVALYFNCKTQLINTFKEVYSNEFEYQGNRLMLIDLNKPLPEASIKHCLSLALNYHNLKHLKLLGA